MSCIRGYLDAHRSFAKAHSATNLSAWKDASLFRLLRNQNSYYSLYVGRISGFLADKLALLEFSRTRDRDTHPFQLSRNDLEGDMEFGSENELSEDESAFADFVKTEDAFAGVRTEKPVDKASSGNNADEQSDRELFLQAIRMLENAVDNPGEKVQPASTEVLEIARQILDFLTTRLRILGSLIYIYSRRRVYFDDPVKGLLDSYKSLLVDRVSLITLQEQCCHEITDALNRSDLPIRAFTVNAADILDSLDQQIKPISKLEKYFLSIMRATPMTSLRDVEFYFRNYNSTIRGALDLLSTISKGDQVQQQNLIYNPIDVQLLQGSIYRDFGQLSFGQKSGIILEMVLLKTERHLIVIDQPEDNLDASSIVNMVAPTLNRLSTDRQIIIATHNSNLVMGLNTSALFVLESGARLAS